MDHITTEAAAQELGVATITVRKACARLGLGEMITPRMRLLKESDMKILRKTVPGKPGRPASKNLTKTVDIP
jgi:hypothetical protein